MRAKDVCAYVRELRGDDYPEALLLRWLGELEGRITCELISCFKTAEPEAVGGDTVLLVPPPYDELYRVWLEMKIDAASEEIERYNNGKRKFDELFSAYCAATIRETTPKRIGMRYV